MMSCAMVQKRLGEGMKERRGDPDCVHYWKIDEHNVGHCVKCGAVNAFGALQEKEARTTAVKIHIGQQRGGKRGRPRKER
jgi:Zn ribbon nucleic-acid-binding protein